MFSRIFTKLSRTRVEVARSLDTVCACDHLRKWSLCQKDPRISPRLHATELPDGRAPAVVIAPQPLTLLAVMPGSHHPSTSLAMMFDSCYLRLSCLPGYTTQTIQLVENGKPKSTHLFTLHRLSQPDVDAAQEHSDRGAGPLLPQQVRMACSMNRHGHSVAQAHKHIPDGAARSSRLDAPQLHATPMLPRPHPCYSLKLHPISPPSSTLPDQARRAPMPHSGSCGQADQLDAAHCTTAAAHAWLPAVGWCLRTA